MSGSETKIMTFPLQTRNILTVKQLFLDTFVNMPLIHGIHGIDYKDKMQSLIY